MKAEDAEEMRSSLLEGTATGGTGTQGSPVPRPKGARVRTAIRGMGEVFITLGLLLLLMVAYQLWWTNVTSAQAITQERQDIVQAWAAPTPSGSATATPGATASPSPAATPSYGTGFALLYIPRLRDHVWGLPIMEGTGKSILAKGAGHYDNSVLPGEVGNFAIAAHRSSHSEPFANFPDLQVGDKVYVQTKTAWFVYTLTKDDPTLTPTDTWVVLPVPGKPGAKPTQRLLTMTTCTPRYGSTGRWAWWGVLSSTTPASAGAPDGLTGTA